uniref:Decaprenyl diphosphate synthase subunit 1 n=1 Tax=Equus caballus TaxID=9796 RepID=F6YPB1_HORSE
MASRWWRWRRCCSWRPPARSPGPGSPGRAGPCGARACADAGAQVSYFNLVKSLTSAFPNMYSISRFQHTTSAACCCSKTRSGEKYTDPFKLGWRDLKGLYEDIRKAVLAGDLILSAASIALARIGNTTVISILTQVIEDLVRGEFLQLGSKENENERFAHYLEKTFKKTASLIANSCKAVSVLGCPDPVVHEIAYQYGKNVGIAFQLIDDVLDFTSCSDQMGKPTSADLKLGLATGPVLFACQQFPEMNAMIMRRFSLPGDVDRARQYVLQSDGVQQTTYLAQRYCHEAVREISKLRPSPERDALIQLSEIVLTRDK